jgi:hypothetical protein
MEHNLFQSATPNDVTLFSIKNAWCFTHMNIRMDKSQTVLLASGELDKDDDRYWAAASIKEKLQTMTYLRECFYGTEATTGRLQGFYQILEQK